MELLQTIQNIGILPLIAFESVEDAVPVGNALVRGGIPLLEVTFRTAAAEEAIQRLTRDCPELIVGAGTIHSVAQAETAIKAGAKFLVTAGFNADVVQWCQQHNVLIMPGTSSATDLETALGFGLEVCKFFPAEVSGGVEALKAFRGPFRQVRFLPTGGIHEGNMAEYLALPNVLAVGGSFVLPDRVIRAKNWEEITRLCEELYRKMFRFELAHVGINTKDAQDAAEITNSFCRLFDVEPREFPSSFFAGTMFEMIKGSFLGTNGHIAVLTNEIERAMAYLQRKGFVMNPETEARDEAGTLQTIYLQEEIGGFAIHLKRR